MAIVSELHIVEEQLSKAKEMLQDSREMVQKMQDIVFCMEIEVEELKKEFNINVIE